MIPETASAGNDRQQSLLPYFQNLPENIPLARPHLAQLAQTEALLPQFVRESRPAMRYLGVLGPLDWEHFPQRDPLRAWPGPIPHPRAAYPFGYAQGRLRRFFGQDQSELALYV